MLPDVDLSLLIGLRTTLEEELWNHESESTMRDKLYSFLNIIYFWLCWVFTAVQVFPPVVENRSCSLVVVCILLTARLLLMWDTGSSMCGLHWLQHMGSVLAASGL